MNDQPVTLRFQVQLDRSRRAHRLVRGNDASLRSEIRGKVPRIARLVALAHHLQGFLERGEVESQKELAELTGLSRPRVTQILNLALLAPDIQQQVLFLPRTEKGRDPITERMIRHVAATPVWSEQRQRWADIARRIDKSLTSGQIAAGMDRPVARFADERAD